MIKNNQAIESFILSSKIAAQKKWKKRNFKLVNNSSKKGKIIYYLFCLIKLFKKDLLQKLFISIQIPLVIVLTTISLCIIKVITKCF